ncbi:MAG: metal-dependent transcriptional regulator [Muribaculaceae bacterium]|nr:metal-dependent transcriptional regulator [Muribaculaceae bacterium]
MKIQKSSEDYLETILILQERNGSARSVEVAAELGFSKASVSVAMKKLRENGYIQMDADGQLRLTDPGRAIAESIYARHKLLTAFFVQLGVSEETAAADACRIEHDISEESYQALLHHVQQSLDGARQS